ncbi:1,2-phenylacetyl-CoA epoxidase subunit B [Paenibacillus sp. MZ04-78.2]|uniref:1,2-phenylacetyl-CoA epoxidase subunit B n=1 Tax=Paenibacillus sp. MZ04-78.2 TaxID=2962034 RepID=UPI0020B69C37|nr:1,2-phenylacetyl-CoA epoxidase subunit B [Paenibacillus sp. MZ04-78.2]MCP3772772.1 1,2-phenylacetyl-CoA epoxidase subunit B [Paenibacillus sp. MZ04-78.2]
MSGQEMRTYDIYEVFSQKDATSKFESQFSLQAPTPEIALSMAQENFMRREESPSNIFVVKSDHIYYMAPENRQALVRLDNKEYRQPAFYGFIPSKWRELKEKNNHIAKT